MPQEPALRRAAKTLPALLIALLAACGDDPVRVDAPAASSPQPTAQPAPAPVPRRRPNVVLVVMDTTRADRCSFLGYRRPTTPYLEGLARTGVAYSSCWSPASWTAPAHASLFTGLRPEHHGLMRENRPYIADSAVTLAERFRDAGYRTCAISNNPNVSRHRGMDQGFERFEEVWREGMTQTDATEISMVRIVAGFPDCDEGHAVALEWVRKRHDADEPFFLFVNDAEPHLPYRPDPEIARQFVDPPASAEELAWADQFAHPQPLEHCFGLRLVPPERLALLSDLYDAEIATLDRKLGRFLDGMRAMGALENSVLVVMGDHGENLGEHGLLDHTLSLHKTLLHVPLLIVAPGRMAPGRVDDLVRLEDVPPTLLDLAGLPGGDAMDGVSLREGLAGRRTWAALDRLEDRQLLSLRDMYPRVDLSKALIGLRSYADPQVHLIRARNGREELYDLETDPREAHDLVPLGDPRLESARTRLEEAYPKRGR